MHDYYYYLFFVLSVIGLSYLSMHSFTLTLNEVLHKHLPLPFPQAFTDLLYTSCIWEAARLYAASARTPVYT